MAKGWRFGIMLSNQMHDARCQGWEIDEREFRWNILKYAYWGIFIDTPSPYENDLLMTLQAKVCFNATGAGMRQSLKSSRSMGTFCKLERKEHDGLNSMQQNQCLDRYLSHWMMSYYFKQDVGEHWVDLFSDFSNSLVALLVFQEPSINRVSRC